MPWLAAALVSLAVSSAACVPAHYPAARRVGMVASVAGVVGLMATAAVQSYARSDEMLTAFSLLSGGGIVVFAIGELGLPPKGPRPETETEKLRRWARILTSRASGAAREGRCPRVRRLEKRVNLYDREVHDFVFMRDSAILTCLGTVPTGLDSATGDHDVDAPAPPPPSEVPVDPNAPPPPPPPVDPNPPPMLPPPVNPKARPPLPPPPLPSPPTSKLPP